MSQSGQKNKYTYILQWYLYDFGNTIYIFSQIANPTSELIESGKRTFTEKYYVLQKIPI